MSDHKGRRGHAAVAAILSDMNCYLPSATINRHDYQRCRTVYGLMNTTYRRVETFPHPEKEHKDLQGLERDLRARLNNLDAAKGIPAKMTEHLNELKAAIDDALAEGIDTEYFIRGITDMLEDKLNAQPEAQPELAKMMPDTKYKKVKVELAEAREKIRKLSEESNVLMLQTKRLEMMRDQPSM
jgi:hypothetical protein